MKIIVYPVKLAFIYRNEVTQCNVRLLGIDTPELHPVTLHRTLSDIKKEKENAVKEKYIYFIKCILIDFI